MSMSVATAKVFQSGNSRALRPPKAFRLKSSIVKLVKTSDGFVAAPPKPFDWVAFPVVRSRTPRS